MHCSRPSHGALAAYMHVYVCIPCHVEFMQIYATTSELFWQFVAYNGCMRECDAVAKAEPVATVPTVPTHSLASLLSLVNDFKSEEIIAADSRGDSAAYDGN